MAFLANITLKRPGWYGEDVCTGHSSSCHSAEVLMFLKSLCKAQTGLLFANTQGFHRKEGSVVRKGKREWMEETKKRSGWV